MISFLTCKALALLLLTHGHLRVESVGRLSDIRVKDVKSDMASESRNSTANFSAKPQRYSNANPEEDKDIDLLCRAERPDLVCSRFSLVGCNCSFYSRLALLNKESGEPLTVYVVVHERGDDHLQYMYNPAMATITDALLESNVSTYVNLRTIPAGTKFDVKGLESGSVLIWIGVGERYKPDWKSLKSQGIHRIYYQTEVKGCGPAAADVDEIWDYSWKNIDRCRSSIPRRYVPPGLVLLHGPTHEDSRVERQVGFLGMGRPCLGLIHQQVHIHGENVWTEADVRRAVSAHPIQLNVHKSCPFHLKYSPGKLYAAFEAFRASQVLGSYGVLVSERCYAKDEESFAGIVEFVNLEDIPKKAYELMNMTFAEFSKYRLEKHNKYKDRFEPFKLFSQAGVFDVLAKLQKRNGITSKNTTSAITDSEKVSER